MTEIEQVARVIDPGLARQLDAGHLNQWGHENWQAVLMKAQAILNLIKPEGWRLIETALKTANDALCEYACHRGPSDPCRRPKDQCAAECGKPAGDALLVVRAALAMIQASPPPPVAP